MEVFKNEIFNIMFNFSFSSQKCYTQVKINLNTYIFMLLKDIFVILQPYIFLGVFCYFGHHGRPASQICNPRLSFESFNSAIILIQKNWALGVLRYGLGQKQPRLVILGHLNFMFGYWNMSKWPYISCTDKGKIYNTFG